jgi:hypothetical protein
MKPRRFGLTIATSCLVLAIGCSKQGENGGSRGKKDRLITIQAGGTLGCEVDYPVAVTYIGRHYPRWISKDNEYWIHFVGGSPFSPINNIDVPTHGKSPQLDITGPPNYYKYEIWSQPDSASTPHKTCKDADDDHDTGLNVKR